MLVTKATRFTIQVDCNLASQAVTTIVKLLKEMSSHV